jgi:ATP-dependent helicase YprA (DUF1998 family)
VADLDLDNLAGLVRDHEDDPDSAGFAAAVLTQLVRPLAEPGGPGPSADIGHFQDSQAADPAVQKLICRAHPAVTALLDLTGGHARPLADLAGAFGARARETGHRAAATGAATALLAALSHVRAEGGRGELSVETHLWLRQLSRIDRLASTHPNFTWSDDGPPAAGTDPEATPPTAYPAIYCRRCGRSGWAVKLAPSGGDLDADQSHVRRDDARGAARVRHLISAPGEDEAAAKGTDVPGLAYFNTAARQLSGQTPDRDSNDWRDGLILPVLTWRGTGADQAAAQDTCPACGAVDAIRPLGSAIATLLSVTLSTLFGAAAIPAREKRALVFTDSVQDAAHRAGFVQARSHTLSLRSVLFDAIKDGPTTLDQLTATAITRAGDSKAARYRLLPPGLADRPSFKPFYEASTLRGVKKQVRERAANRLSFDAMLEFGLNARLGRTLEMTGTACAEVEAGPPETLIATARAAIERAGWQADLATAGGSADASATGSASKKTLSSAASSFFFPLSPLPL